MLSEKLFIGGTVLPATALLICVIGIPALYSVLISVTDMNLGTRLMDAQFVGIRNFIRVFQDPEVSRISLTTLLWTVCVLGLSLAVGISTALILNTLGKLGGKLLVVWLLPWIMPDVAAGMIWQFLLHPEIGALNYSLARIGLIDGPQAWLSDPRIAMWGILIAAVWRAFPFNMTMCYASLQTLPDELRDAARIDGVNAWQYLRFIQIPWMTPVLSISTLLGFIWTYNWFSLIYSMTRGGPGMATTTIPIQIYKRSMVYFDFSRASAFSLVSLLFLSIFIVIYIRNVYKKGTL